MGFLKKQALFTMCFNSSMASRYTYIAHWEGGGHATLESPIACFHFLGFTTGQTATFWKNRICLEVLFGFL